MSDIVVENLGLSFGRPLFSGVSFSLKKGEQLGVVGDNGAGKSSFLKCIEGKQEPSSGLVRPRKGLRIVRVEQDLPDHLKDLTFAEMLLSGIPQEERLSQEWRADVVFDSFATPNEMRDRTLAKLSGGWQKLAMIGRAFVSEPDIILLDEPTNHLDLSKVMLLEDWINRELCQVATIIVSHDRRLLNQCTTRTLFLRSHNSRIYSSSYSTARESLQEDDRAEAMKIERESAKAKQLRESAHKLRQIGVDNYSAAALRKSNQIAERASAIEKAMPNVPVEQPREVRLNSTHSNANRLISIEKVTIDRPDGSPLFHIKHLEIGCNDRLVLLGRNGTGKTRFVRCLVESFQDRETARQKGIVISDSCVFAYLAQGSDQLPQHSTIGDVVRDRCRVGNSQLTAQLVTAGFPYSQHSTEVGQLSPGQQTRLMLLCLALSEPNVFLLDEPTNNLDISGQEKLEATILAQDAAAVLVSHDRAFSEIVGTRFLVIEDGRLVELKSPGPFYQALEEGVKVSQLLET